MMSRWSGLCGRRKVTLKGSKIVLLHGFMPKFCFQGFVIEAKDFVPHIWVVYHRPVHQNLKQIFWEHPFGRVPEPETNRITRSGDLCRDAVLHQSRVFGEVV